MPSVRVGNLELFWREAGTGRPVLFLMGLETDHRGWARLVRSLKHSVRCISLDNRDVGQSGLATAPYAVEAMADDAIGVIDHLGLETVSVVGQSMGGAIAQELARKVPRRIDRTILISSFSVLDARSRSALKSWKALRRALPLRDYYSIVFPWMYTPEEYATPGFIDAIFDSAMANPNPQPFEAFARQVDAVVNFNSSSWLPDVATRTLIINGREDAMTPPAKAHELAARIAGSDMIEVAGAGHGLAMTSAIEPLIPAMRAFLDR